MAADNFGLRLPALSKALTKAFQSREVNVIISLSARICFARSCAVPSRKALTDIPAVEAARTINCLISGDVRRSMRSWAWSVVGIAIPFCTENIRLHSNAPQFVFRGGSRAPKQEVASVKISM